MIISKLRKCWIVYVLLLTIERELNYFSTIALQTDKKYVMLFFIELHN